MNYLAAEQQVICPRKRNITFKTQRKDIKRELDQENGKANVEETIRVPNNHNKGKAVPLQAWKGPDVSRKLRFSNFVTTAQDGGKVVSLTHRPPSAPGPKG